VNVVAAGDGSRANSRPASAAGSTHSNATLLVLAGASVEPAVTAQAIKRRKAAVVRQHSVYEPLRQTGFACAYMLPRRLCLLRL
jgi:hypothetical protein